MHDRQGGPELQRVNSTSRGPIRTFPHPELSNFIFVFRFSGIPIESGIQSDSQKEMLVDFP